MKRSTTIVLATVFAVCAAAAAAQPNLRPITTPSTAEARRTAQAFGYCVADRSPAKAAATLAMDFTAASYNRSMKVLLDVNRDCFERGQMRSATLLIAGAIAERLLAKQTTPLNARLARAAALPAPLAWSPTDAVAICVVRSMPDQVAALLATEIASEAEVVAAKTLEPVVPLCSRNVARIELSTAGLRAILATVAFRSVKAGI